MASDYAILFLEPRVNVSRPYWTAVDAERSCSTKSRRERIEKGACEAEKWTTLVKSCSPDLSTAKGKCDETVVELGGGCLVRRQ